MRDYNIFYNKITGSIRVVTDEIDGPKDEFEKVGHVRHDMGTQSAQLLRNKAIKLVTEKYPENDIGVHTEVKFDDAEPFGHNETEQSDRRLHPEKFEDEPEATEKRLEKDKKKTDPEAENRTNEVTVKDEAVTLKVGEKHKIKATAKPKSKDGFAYESTNKDIASVNEDGEITAVAEGTATVRSAAKSNREAFGDTQVTVTAE